MPITDRPIRTKVVVLASGGLDSTICAYIARSRGHLQVHLLHFQYGQRNAAREYDALVKVWQALGEQGLAIRSLQGVFNATSSSILSGGLGSMTDVKDLIVPGRNAVFLSMAFSYAAQIGARHVYIGAKESKFPDCQISFLAAIEQVMNMGLGRAREEEGYIFLQLPLAGMTRADTLIQARALNVPIELTYSCYEGGKEPCGKCGACIDRASAGI